MSNQCRKPVAAAIGAAFAGSMLLTAGASAAGNPFGLSELNGGYAQIASGQEGKCGAGKCGAGKCGMGKCGAKPVEDRTSEPLKDETMKCGAGKCGAGKCGGN